MNAHRNEPVRLSVHAHGEDATFLLDGGEVREITCQGVVTSMAAGQVLASLGTPPWWWSYARQCAAALTFPDTDPREVVALLQQSAEEKGDYLASRPGAPTWVTAALLCDEQWDVRYNAARDGDVDGLPEATLRHLVSLPSWEGFHASLGRRLTRHPYLLVTLAGLASHEVGENPALLAVPEALQVLLTVDSPAGRYGLTGRPDLGTFPDHVHDVLARDAISDVRLAYARNPHALPRLLHDLATDRDARVRAAVAVHANATDQALAVLSADTTKTVQRALDRRLRRAARARAR